MVYFPNVYELEDTICFWNRYCDTVFGINEGILIPRFVLVGSGLKTARQGKYLVNQAMTDSDIVPVKIFETGDFVFIECVKNLSSVSLS